MSSVQELSVLINDGEWAKVLSICRESHISAARLMDLCEHVSTLLPQSRVVLMVFARSALR